MIIFYFIHSILGSVACTSSGACFCLRYHRQLNEMGNLYSHENRKTYKVTNISNMILYFFFSSICFMFRVWDFSFRFSDVLFIAIEATAIVYEYCHFILTLFRFNYRVVDNDKLRQKGNDGSECMRILYKIYIENDCENHIRYAIRVVYSVLY